MFTQRGGADTLKFNLHIIGCAKKGCKFNQKRCEFKNLLKLKPFKIKLNSFKIQSNSFKIIINSFWFATFHKEICVPKAIKKATIRIYTVTLFLAIDSYIVGYGPFSFLEKKNFGIV